MVQAIPKGIERYRQSELAGYVRKKARLLDVLM
jgi:hypothetical protein